MERQTIVALALVGLLMLVGCIGTTPGRYFNIIFDGEMEASDEGFYMEGNVTTAGGTSDNMALSNVAAELYTAEGKLIHREPLGSIDAPYGRAHVLLAISDQPEYVLFTSPDFWDDPVTEVEYYERFNETDYGIKYASSPNDFPEVIREQKDG